MWGNLTAMFYASIHDRVEETWNWMVDVFFEGLVDRRTQYCGKSVPRAINLLSAKTPNLVPHCRFCPDVITILDIVLL
jgi:hypothetical protein